MRLVLRATLKHVHYMAAGQEYRWQVGGSHSLMNGDGRCISSRRPGRSRAGRWLIASHASTASGDSTNSVRSASTWRAAVVTLLRTNAVTLVPAAATARSISARSSGVALTSMCAVERRCVPAGANPARQLSLQPEAVGAVRGGNELD